MGSEQSISGYIWEKCIVIMHRNEPVHILYQDDLRLSYGG